MRPSTTMKTLLAMLKVVLVVLMGIRPCLPQNVIEPRIPAAKEDQRDYNRQDLVKYCLQQGDCRLKYGGSCFDIRSAIRPRCDEVVHDGLCTENPGDVCRCCINCSKKRCVPETEGESLCRKECAENEFAVSECNPYCQCCQPCNPTKCKGRCVNHPDLCGLAKEYIDGVCDGKLGSKCTCCVTCEPDPGCEKSGGECVAIDEECPCGLLPSLYFGCNNGSEKCKCCTPCPPSHSCSEGIEAGRCVPQNHYCNGHDEYITDEACCQGMCSCCKTCNPDKQCLVEHGNCYKKEVGCGPGMVASKQGKCTSDNCVCCIPEPCPNSCNCTEGPNPGRCMSLPFTMKYNEYPSEEKCIGRKCSCYKTCTPDVLCSAVNGSCFTTSTGCAQGLVPSDIGTCNNENCICCVKQCLLSKKCTFGEEPGRCENDKRMCNSPGEYISNEKLCLEDSCFCCKTCQPEASCEERGMCFDAQKGCGPGFKKSEIGRCKNPESCVCCELERDCNPSLECISDGDSGRCEVDEKNCSSPTEYISKDTPCKGEKGCFCCKTCEPDDSCINSRGKCYTARDGCPKGYSLNLKGRCKNNTNCICCSPDFNML